MHVEKNVCDSLIGILLDIRGQTKDTLETHKDLQAMELRNELHPIVLDKGRHKLPMTAYTVSKAEKTKMCETLSSIKVPTSYCANMKRLVSMKDLKLRGMKAHDCHVMLTQMLPVAIRGILPNKVRDPIIKLCSFFNTISQKVIDPNKLEKLQEDIIITLCRLEMHFSSSFFDMMVHLIVHLMK